MTAIRSNHARVLAQLITARKALLTEAIVTGLEQMQYWRCVGELKGLDDALKLSEEADYKLNGEDIDGS